MERAMIPKSQVTRQLLDLAQPGGVLLVHCAFSQVKPVEDGPEGLIVRAAVCFRPGGHAGDAQHDRRR